MLYTSCFRGYLHEFHDARRCSESTHVLTLSASTKATISVATTAAPSHAIGRWEQTGRYLHFENALQAKWRKHVTYTHTLIIRLLFNFSMLFNFSLLGFLFN